MSFVDKDCAEVTAETEEKSNIKAKAKHLFVISIKVRYKVFYKPSLGVPGAFGLFGTGVVLGLRGLSVTGVVSGSPPPHHPLILPLTAPLPTLVLDP